MVIAASDYIEEGRARGGLVWRRRYFREKGQVPPGAHRVSRARRFDFFFFAATATRVVPLLLSVLAAAFEICQFFYIIF
jgi:hypothetical protein